MRNFYSRAAATSEDHAADVAPAIDARCGGYWDFVGMFTRCEIADAARFTVRRQGELAAKDWQQISENDQRALARVITRWQAFDLEAA